MAKFKAKKTTLHGVFRTIAANDGGLARILKAAFDDYEDAKAWAAKYSAEHFDCPMHIDEVETKIPAWDGRA